MNDYSRHIGGWISYDWKRVVEMPMTPAVYAVYLDQELVYLGQTSNLRNRFREHNFRFGYKKNVLLPWVDVPDYTVIRIKASGSKKYGDWAMRELRLIKRLRPRFNIKGVRGKLKAA
jgi:excinuclease UvrABC nuclease subunit